MKDENQYKVEWSKTVASIKEKNISFKELDYFLDLAENNFGLDTFSSVHPKVIFCGHGFPDEIVKAMGLTPLYFLGGSFESTKYQEEILPRDADDVTRSFVGVLKDKGMALTKDDVVILPVYNDSMKKLPAILSDFVTVMSYEVPPEKNNPLYVKRFTEEVVRVTKELENHFKKKVSRKELKAQCEISKNAGLAWKKFEGLYKKDWCTISFSAMLVVAASLHCCRDKKEWESHLNLLSEEILQHEKNQSGKQCPSVLLFGSPIYAPDYKTPFIFEEMNLKVKQIIHPDVVHITALCNFDAASASVKKLAGCYFEKDISPAYIRNTTLSDSVVAALKENNPDGIVVHILKGHIEYDFEMARIEKMIPECSIPVMRLETMYNHQDIEQLRLRLEAFSEMLGKKTRVS